MNNEEMKKKDREIGIKLLNLFDIPLSELENCDDETIQVNVALLIKELYMMMWGGIEE